MDNLIFSLNATIPIFLMMVVGYFLNHIGLFDDSFASKMNKFVFNVCLPIMLFKELSTADFYETWDTKFVVFCFVVSLLSILIAAACSKLIKNTSVRGEFMQGAYRSSAALLGCAFVQNIYGEAGSAALMIIAVVPLYNVAAVIILNLMSPEKRGLDQALAKKTLKGIITNPIILGIIIGFLWSLLHISQPAVMQKTVSSLSNLATPLGLMALGASFDFKKAKENIRLAVICSCFKLIIFTGIFLPIAIKMGFYAQKLVAILVMLGAATTVSCFVMAKNMGHEGTLTASTVALTTIASAFTLTGWLFVVKSIGVI